MKLNAQINLDFSHLKFKIWVKVQHRNLLTFFFFVIAQSGRASERNSVVVGSNSIQANFL